MKNYPYFFISAPRGHHLSAVVVECLPLVQDIVGSFPVQVISKTLKMVVFGLPPWRLGLYEVSITTDWLVLV